jgi:hypothetical protein
MTIDLKDQKMTKEKFWNCLLSLKIFQEEAVKN